MEYDALIVGGRVAGASLALLLARAGRTVLIVDRDRFPSDTMSTHYIHGQMVPLLAKVGVLDELLTAGFRRLTRTRTYVDDCIFEGPLAPNGAYALAPRRDVLDKLLLDRAVAHGVEFAERTRADGLIDEDGRVAGAVLRGPNGERREVRARVVIGADGKYSSVAKWVGAESYNEVAALRPAYYGHYHGLQPLPDSLGVAVEFFFGHDHIGYAFPMRTGEDCLVLEIQPEEFDAFRADPQAAFEEHYRALPGMNSRMRDARLDGKIIGVKGVENYFRKPYGPGWVLTGDAGYLKDPSTGFGIGDALRQSFWLVEALDGWYEGADWDEALSRFQRTRDEAMMPFYQATLGFTRMRDPGPGVLAWMKAILATSASARALAYALPDLLPPPMLAAVRSRAFAFGASPEPAPAPADD
ncbi:MAG TPA: FAD-dependent monooxygenase [Thermomicrobiaceae bacterium]|nr:FAD-dependent monooxygenase [Thermomicrobiaceae bacterium]